MENSMNSFIAAPGVEYKLGMSICRSKRRCDVVVGVGEEYAPLSMVAVMYRPMSWWESLKHEIFGDCKTS